MQRDLNFFSVYTAPMDSQGRVDRVTLFGLIATGVCLAAVLGVFGLFLFGDAALQSQIRSMKSYLTSPDVVSTRKDLGSALAKVGALNQYASIAGGQVDEFKKLEQPDSILLGAIAKDMPGDVTVRSMSYRNGRFTLACSSAQELSAAGMTHKLRSDGFADAAYSAVTKNGTSYDFSISFSAGGGASK